MESSHCNWDSAAQLVDPKGDNFNCKNPICGKLPALAWEHTLAYQYYQYIDLHVDSCY